MRKIGLCKSSSRGVRTLLHAIGGVHIGVGKKELSFPEKTKSIQSK